VLVGARDDEPPVPGSEALERAEQYAEGHRVDERRLCQVDHDVLTPRVDRVIHRGAKLRGGMEVGLTADAHDNGVAVDRRRDVEVVIEIGAGTSILTVRHFTERFDARYIRINAREPEMQGRFGIGLLGGGLETLQRIAEIMGAGEQSAQEFDEWYGRST